MKHTLSIFTITILLGASFLGLPSCASNDVKNPQPPVTVLKSEPTSAPLTTQAVPADSTTSPAQQDSSKPLASAAPAPPLQAAPQTVSATIVPAPAAVSPSPAPAAIPLASPAWNTQGWLWLILLAIMLLLLAVALYSRRRKKALPIPVAAGPPVKEIQVTAYFNGQKHQMHFSPGTTVKKVTAWAAYQCEIFDRQTTEVYLAVHSYSAPLTATAHIGRFVEHNKHHLEVDVLTFAKDTALAEGVILTKDSRPPAEVLSVSSAALAEDEVLVQGAGMDKTVKISARHGAPFHEIIASTARMGKFPEKDAFIFLEDSATPLNPHHRLDTKHPRHRSLHVHPQKEIIVTVFHNGQKHYTHFSPATTLKKVTAWASYQFEIDHETAEVYLAIHGYSAPLSGTAHIGRFVEHDKKHLELDVVTLKGTAVTEEK